MPCHHRAAHGCCIAAWVTRVAAATPGGAGRGHDVASSSGLGLAPVLWLFFALMFLVDLCVPFFWTTANTLLQETVEPDFLGRVFGVLGIVMSLAMPVGMLLEHAHWWRYLLDILVFRPDFSDSDTKIIPSVGSD